MKKIICFTACVLLMSFRINRDRKLLEEFEIGEFTYRVYDEAGYINTAKQQSRFFVFYRKGKSASLCSSYLSTLKDGRQTTKGTYSHTNQYLECKEYYTDPKIGADSMMKRYYLNSEGDLIMKEHIRYKDGQEEKTAY